MELSASIKRFQHRENRIHIGHHMNQLLDVDIQQMEIKTCEQMIATVATIKRRELHFGSFRGKTNLLQNHHAIFYSQFATHIFQHIIGIQSFFDLCIECHIHAFRHHKWIGCLSGRCGRSHSCGRRRITSTKTIH